MAATSLPKSCAAPAAGKRQKPVFEGSRPWLAADQLPKDLRQVDIAEAIRYALGRMAKSRGLFFENGN